VVNTGYFALSQFLSEAETILFLLTQERKKEKEKKKKKSLAPGNYGRKSLGSADNCSLENT